MYENGIKQEAEDTREIMTSTAPITKIAQGVVDGNSHFYIMLEGSDAIFDVSVVDFIDIIRYDVGDEVTIEYKEGEQSNTVMSLNGVEKAGGSSGETEETQEATEAAEEETE